jgi:hypothetical protein
MNGDPKFKQEGEAILIKVADAKYETYYPDVAKAECEVLLDKHNAKIDEMVEVEALSGKIIKNKPKKK